MRAVPWTMRLTDSQIDEALARSPGWTRIGDAIVRTCDFPSFAAAIAFVNAVADLAEAADHHPDIDIRYRRVTLALTTHDAGGLTRRDFALARQIDAAID